MGLNDSVLFVGRNVPPFLIDLGWKTSFAVSQLYSMSQEAIWE